MARRILLALESSCDETAAALVDAATWPRPKILSEIVASQIELHQAYGGVVPELAAREHLANFPVVIRRALEAAHLTLEAIDGIVVTSGPGLKGCLLMGCGVAHGLGAALDRPVLGVNHIEGHLLAPLMDNEGLDFPYLALVVSGGHTELVKVQGVGSYEVIARTQDDAVGEAFDKSAALLGFPYPGGAALAKLADATQETRFRLPKVMKGQAAFSFSGLKTAIAQLVDRELSPVVAAAEREKIRAELALAIQRAIVAELIAKLQRAITDTGLTRVVVTGGVSANHSLRAAVAALPGVTCFFPTFAHSSDNAAMIGFVGALRRGEIQGAVAGTIRSRWPVEELRPAVG